MCLRAHKTSEINVFDHVMGEAENEATSLTPATEAPQPKTPGDPTVQKTSVAATTQKPTASTSMKPEAAVAQKPAAKAQQITGAATN